jgi:hypothetical protein
LRRTGLVAVGLLVALIATGAARGQLANQGDVVVAFDGSISPHSLPRTGTAPVAVSIDGSFKSAEGVDPPPQLRTISIGINRRGRIFDRGLPTCRVRKIQPATIRAARQICGAAIVGRGRVQLRVHLAIQAPFTFAGPMLIFHAERSGGNRRLLAQVYGHDPPSAFVLNFKVLDRPGEFGTTIKTSLPRSASEWAYLTHFEMKLRRIYTFEGQRHSYISAGCPAPSGFPGAVYDFARGSFGFAEGQQVTTTLIRDCTVRK